VLAAHKWDSLDMHGCRGVRVGLRTLVSSSIAQGAVVSRRRGACQTSKMETRILLESGVSRDWVKDYRYILLASSNSALQLAFYPAVEGCRQSGGWKPTCLYCTPRVFSNTGCDFRYV
jgi:hypothetical protein